MYLKLFFGYLSINCPGPFRRWAMIGLLIPRFRIRRLLLSTGGLWIFWDEQAFKQKLHGNHLFFNDRPGLPV